MTNNFLARLSDQMVYSALAVLTLGFVAFVGQLAVIAQHADRRNDAPLRLVHANVPTTASPPHLPEGPRNPPQRLGGAGLGLTWLGALLMLIAITLRGLSVMRVPFGNMYEFATTGATLVLAVYLALSLRGDVRWLGAFVTGPVVLTLGLAVSVYYTQASQLLPSLHSFWLVIHVSVAILATALFTVGFSVSILYLVKLRFEHQSKDDRAFLRALPPASSLDRTAYAIHVAAFPLWTFTLIAGAIWAQQAWGSYWQWDPKEVWTFIIWIVYAAYLHARATSGWSSQRATYLALAGYGCVLINYMVVNMYFVGMHSYSGL